MIDVTSVAQPRVGRRAELGKVVAMLRRDFLTALSYRTAFVGDIVNLVVQIAMFGLVGRIVDPSMLPSYGTNQSTYIGFVAIGIAVTTFMAVGLARMSEAVRREQMTGTLEMLLLTPTRLATLQLGWIVYDLLYVPIRTAGLLVVVAVMFDTGFHAAGALPAAAVLLGFVPCIWGIGVASAAAVLTFRRGNALLGYVTIALAFMSGAYIPLDVLPSWVGQLQGWNPVALTLESIRALLIGHAGWTQVALTLSRVVPVSGVVFVLGTVGFRAALRRELKAGSLGQY